MCSHGHVIPNFEVVGTLDLPADAMFWMPEPNEIDPDEGVGFFRDTWAILDASREAAQGIADEERHLLRVAAELAMDAAHYEQLAKIVEIGFDWDSADEAYDPSATERLALEPVAATDEDIVLDGLDLGVAGLAYALSFFGAVPVASCRAHVPVEQSWTESPVVVFAAKETTARALAPLAARTGCRFTTDVVRPEFIGLTARSVVELMNLASAILTDGRN